jgi:hypothetical protein
MSSSLVYRECAEILEHMKQLAEAGQLYEAAQYYDKADTPHLDQQFLNLVVLSQVSAGNRIRASTVGCEHSSKELLEHGVNSYSEHLHEPETVYLVL